MNQSKCFMWMSSRWRHIKNEQTLERKRLFSARQEQKNTKTKWKLNIAQMRNVLTVLTHWWQSFKCVIHSISNINHSHRIAIALFLHENSQRKNEWKAMKIQNVSPVPICLEEKCAFFSPFWGKITYHGGGKCKQHEFQFGDA